MKIRRLLTDVMLGLGLTLSLGFLVSASQVRGHFASDALMAQPSDVTSPTASSHAVVPSARVLSSWTSANSAQAGDVAYVCLPETDQVGLVDIATHAVIGAIDAGASGCRYPLQVKITPDGSEAYVTCAKSDSLLIIETATHHAIANVPVLPGPRREVAFTRNGAYALVGSGSGARLTVVDTQTHQAVNFIPTPSYVVSLVTHPYRDVIYATAYGGVLVIDAVTFATTDSISFGSQVWDVVVSPNGRWVFAGDRDGAGVAVIDTESNALHTTINGLGELYGLEISPDGSLVFAAGLQSGVHVINGRTFSRIATIGDIGSASEVAITCDGSQLYVGNWSNQVVVIDAATLAVQDRISRSGWSTSGIGICPQHVVNQVFLQPSAQTHRGGRGQVVAYQETLVNVTGATDSFSLTLGSHTWDTALSTDLLGPVASGDAVTFTLSVTVPVDAEWYSTDGRTTCASRHPSLIV